MGSEAGLLLGSRAPLVLGGCPLELCFKGKPKLPLATHDSCRILDSKGKESRGSKHGREEAATFLLGVSKWLDPWRSCKRGAA